jgi:hypothetical protein
MSENKWIYYEAGARAIARQRRGPDKEPTATEHPAGSSRSHRMSTWSGSPR